MPPAWPRTGAHVPSVALTPQMPAPAVSPRLAVGCSTQLPVYAATARGPPLHIPRLQLPPVGAGTATPPYKPCEHSSARTISSSCQPSAAPGVSTSIEASVASTAQPEGADIFRTVSDLQKQLNNLQHWATTLQGPHAAPAGAQGVSSQTTPRGGTPRGSVSALHTPADPKLGRSESASLRSQHSLQSGCHDLTYEQPEQAAEASRTMFARSPSEEALLALYRERRASLKAEAPGRPADAADAGSGDLGGSAATLPPPSIQQSTRSRSPELRPQPQPQPQPQADRGAGGARIVQSDRSGGGGFGEAGTPRDPPQRPWQLICQRFADQAPRLVDSQGGLMAGGTPRTGRCLPVRDLADLVRRHLLSRFGALEVAGVQAALRLALCTQEQVDLHIAKYFDDCSFSPGGGLSSGVCSVTSASPVDALRRALPPVRLSEDHFKLAVPDLLLHAGFEISEQEALQLHRLLAVDGRNGSLAELVRLVDFEQRVPPAICTNALNEAVPCAQPRRATASGSELADDEEEAGMCTMTLEGAPNCRSPAGCNSSQSTTPSSASQSPYAISLPARNPLVPPVPINTHRTDGANLQRQAQTMTVQRSSRGNLSVSSSFRRFERSGFEDLGDSRTLSKSTGLRIHEEAHSMFAAMLRGGDDDPSGAFSTSTPRASQQRSQRVESHSPVPRLPGAPRVSGYSRAQTPPSRTPSKTGKKDGNASAQLATPREKTSSRRPASPRGEQLKSPRMRISGDAHSASSQKGVGTGTCSSRASSPRQPTLQRRNSLSPQTTPRRSSKPNQSPKAAATEPPAPREPRAEKQRANSLHSLLAFAAEVKSLQQQQQPSTLDGPDLSTTTTATADSSDTEPLAGVNQQPHQYAAISRERGAANTHTSVGVAGRGATARAGAARPAATGARK